MVSRGKDLKLSLFSLPSSFLGVFSLCTVMSYGESTSGFFLCLDPRAVPLSSYEQALGVNVYTKGSGRLDVLAREVRLSLNMIVEHQARTAR